MAARPLVLAHRGASARAPENTLAAFALARRLGADGVELDVRRTADGVLVVHHDVGLPGLGAIKDAPLAELRRARPEVPTLEEALAATAGLVVNVELKCLPWEDDADGPGHPLVPEVVEIVGPRTPAVIVSSFDLDAVDACRARAPELATAWLTVGRPLEQAAHIAADRGHQWIHPDRDAVLAGPGAPIAAAHELGVRVDVWTVDDPHEIRELARAGVDAVITNVPDVAVAALAPPA